MARPQPRYKKGDKIGGQYLVHDVKMGGMGEVYLCLDLEELLPVALKTFQHHLLDNLNIRQMFKEEIATWVSLEKHPHIVRCFSMQLLNNQPFMLLEWVAGKEERGTDLRSWLKSQIPLDFKMALDFTIHICIGLKHANKKQPGLVHRDLKPENILISYVNLAKITDFGLAQVFEKTGANLSGLSVSKEKRQSTQVQNGIVGTPAYMAPEQWRNIPIDGRADIYAIGCILYEMLTGHMPFQSSTPEELRQQHLEADIPLLNGNNWSADLNEILSCCLAKKPDERYPTVNDLLDDVIIVYQQQIGYTPNITENNTDFTYEDYISRAFTFWQLERHQDALADLEQALEIKTNPTSMLHGLRGLVFSSLGQNADAIKDHNQAILLNPDAPLEYNNRGYLYHDLHDYELALNDFNQALILNPNLAIIYNNRGRTHMALGRWEEALTDFNHALRLDSTYYRAVYNRGTVYINLGKNEEALKDFNRAIQLNPVYIDVFGNRGATLFRLGRLNEALKDLNRAIEIDPEQPFPYANRGSVYVNLKEYQKALTDFNQAIRLEPKISRFYINRAYVNLHLDRYPEALADYDYALKLDANLHEAYLGRGQIIAVLGEHQKALADFDRAIELMPNHAPIYFSRAKLHFEIQNYPRALADIEKFMQLDASGNAEAHLTRGDILAELNRKQEAIQAYTKAIKLDNKFADAFNNRGYTYFEIKSLNPKNLYR